jgi:hypothetical protein
MTTRRWYSPFNYEEAVLHVKKYRNNQTQLAIGSPSGGVLKLIGGIEARAVVVYYGRWARPEDGSVSFYEDGRIELQARAYSRGSSTSPVYHYWGRGLGAFFRHYAGVDIRQRGEVGQIKIPGTTGSRIGKCRTCHGYKWQGEETENVLWELLRNKTEVTRHYQQHEAARHYQPCERCAGTGRAEYGKQPLWLDIPGSYLFLDPETKAPMLRV